MNLRENIHICKYIEKPYEFGAGSLLEKNSILQCYADIAQNKPMRFYGPATGTGYNDFRLTNALSIATHLITIRVPSIEVTTRNLLFWRQKITNMNKLNEIWFNIVAIDYLDTINSYLSLYCRLKERLTNETDNIIIPTDNPIDKDSEDWDRKKWLYGYD